MTRAAAPSSFASTSRPRTRRPLSPKSSPERWCARTYFVALNFVGTHPTLLFEVGAPRFPGEPAFARGGARPGWTARPGRLGGTANERDEAGERVRPVAFLGTVALCRDHQHAFLRQATAGEPREAHPHRLGQRTRMAQIEAELHRAGHLVDVLAAGARGADEAFFQLALVQGEVVADRDHRTHLPTHLRWGRPSLSPAGWVRNEGNGHRLIEAELNEVSATARP